MVATGLPVTSPAPQAAKGTSAGSQSGTETTENGFFSTLAQVLGTADASPSTQENLDALVQQVVQGSDDEAGAGADAVPTAIPLAVLQPLDIRAAQLIAQRADAEAGGLAVGLGGNLEEAMAAALSAGTKVDAGAVLEPAGGMEQGDTAFQLPGVGTLPQPGTETNNLKSAEQAVHRPLQAPVGTPAWSDELGARLQLMTDKGQHTASLRLSPEHLGPLEVQIAVKDDRATVWFGAAHADTRAALEQALPRLRELFAAQGLSLAHSGVFQEAPKDFARAQAPLGYDNGNGEAGAAVEETSAAAPAYRTSLVDAYA